MWKPEYAKKRREKYQSDADERDRRKQQGRTPEQNREYMRQYYAARKEGWNNRTQEQRDRYNESRRERYKSDPELRERCKLAASEWFSNNPEKRKSQRIKRYGLTLGEFESMLIQQRGQCAICGYSDMSKPSIFPLIDHCHKSGRVRGLLCAHCNLGLGKFADSAERLKSAIKYIKKSIDK